MDKTWMLVGIVAVLALSAGFAIPDEPMPPAPEPPPFPQAELEAMLDTAGGTSGVVVYDLPTATQVYSHNLTTQFPAASLIKIPVVLALYEQVQQGILSLDEQLTLRQEDIVGGSGSLQYAPIGSTYTLRDLAARALYDSDNTATNMLLDRLGGLEPVNALLERIGAHQTQMQRYLMDFEARQQGRDNYTSPADMLLMLAALEHGEIIGLDGAQEVLDALAQTRDRRKIPALLPPEAVVRNKIGVLAGVEHDAAIIETAHARRYIVVLMSMHLPDNEAGITAMARGSRLIYDYESGW